MKAELLHDVRMVRSNRFATEDQMLGNLLTLRLNEPAKSLRSFLSLLALSRVAIRRCFPTLHGIIQTNKRRIVSNSHRYAQMAQ